jgi:hypothetical protein
MYGVHDHKTAMLIAEVKTHETGQEHVAIPIEKEPDLWTIGLAVEPPNFWERLSWREGRGIAPSARTLPVMAQIRELKVMLRRKLSRLPR